MSSAVATPSKWILFKLYRDPEAKEQLIIDHLSLVKYVAERVKDNLPPEVDKDDLVSYGIFGLIDAIEKFDHNRGIKFETYAIPRIRGAILDGLRAIDTAPRSMRQKAKQLGKAYAEVEKRLGRAATDEEVAKELNVDMETLNSMLAETSRLPLLSLDELAMQDGESSTTLGDRIEDKNSYDPIELIELTETRKALIDGIESLSKQERLVITLYYYEGLTLKETSEVLDLSESRISQIRTKAVLKLREKLLSFE
ncbi:MAG: FliA/WhiG family RNA polymerase sigma factor [Actinomycetota bacterium]|nr:FliA/WhiG family RNA polymerase sigma factor [Actinomycetota bacterium]